MKQKKHKLLLWFLGTSLFVAAGSWVWWQMWMVLPMGSGAAGPAVDRTAFTQPWGTREVMLVGIGDSVTAGFGASPGHSYFDRLVKNSADDPSEIHGVNLSVVFPNLIITNLSVSGSTSPQHARTQVPKLTRQPRNVVGVILMTTGGNDLIHNYGRTPAKEGAMYGAAYDQAQGWVTNFSTRLETMLAQIEGSFPGGSHIFLANIYDPTDGLGDIHRAGLPVCRSGLMG